MTAPTLSAHNVSHRYGDIHALDNLSVDLHQGEVLAIVGPNGCGKTTLLKVLSGQITPHAGDVTLHNPTTPLSKIPAVQRARRIALVPQHASSGFDYTVRQVVLMGRWPLHAGKGPGAVLGFETAEDRHAADNAMWTTDVHHLADRGILGLSGGERQRVSIARALAQDTPILLLDEPTSSLDLWHQFELLAHLRTLAQQGRSIVLVTHDLHHAMTHAHRVLLMDRGQAIACGTPADTLTPGRLETVYRVSVRKTNDGTLHFRQKT